MTSIAGKDVPDIKTLPAIKALNIDDICQLESRGFMLSRKEVEILGEEKRNLRTKIAKTKKNIVEAEARIQAYRRQIKEWKRELREDLIGKSTWQFWASTNLKKMDKELQKSKKVAENKAQVYSRCVGTEKAEVVQQILEEDLDTHAGIKKGTKKVTKKSVLPPLKYNVKYQTSEVEAAEFLLDFLSEYD